jgi:hypothetical protein
MNKYLFFELLLDKIGVFLHERGHNFTSSFTHCTVQEINRQGVNTEAGRG